MSKNDYISHFSIINSEHIVVYYTEDFYLHFMQKIHCIQLTHNICSISNTTFFETKSNDIINYRTNKIHAMHAI